jgi:hypothetical protein
LTVAASGKYAVRLDEVRDLIAASAAFRTWTGTANAAAAKLRAHVGWFPDGTTLPLALVDHLGMSAEKVSSASEFDVTGYVIGVLFETEAPTASVSTYMDEIYSFLNTISSIEDEMLTELNSDPGSYPSIIGFDGPEFGWPNSDNAAGGVRRYDARYMFQINGHT